LRDFIFILGVFILGDVMLKPTKSLNLWIIMAIILGLTGSAMPVPEAPVRLSAQLIELALSEPHARLRLIIQKSGPGNQAEHLVESLGGEILNELELLNAFSAKIEAAELARLSADASVAWVALDAPVSAADNGSPSPHITLRSEFNQADYNADSASWGAGWSEVGEVDGPRAGQVAIESFFAGLYQGLRLMGTGVGIQTSLDLSMAAGALLSLEFRRKDFGPRDAVRIEASLDGDEWSTLDQIQGSGSDAELVSAQLDLSPFQGQQLMLRLSSALSTPARLYLDYLQVDYTTSPREAPVFENRVLLPLVVQTGQQEVSYTLNGATSMDALYSTGTLLDEFNSISYANNDGLVSWSGDWVEDDPAGQGPSGGYIHIEYDNYYGAELRLENDPNTEAHPSVWRRKDLTAGVTGAVLSFDFRTSNAQAMQDQVLVQVSGDDGQTYHTLEVIETYSGSVQRSRRYDISAYTTGVTRVRFMLGSGYTAPHAYFAIDNVQIAYTTSGANEVRDEFHSLSYAGEDGIGTWRTPWIEYDPYGGFGPEGGYVFVSGERLGFHYIYANCDYIQRAVNLQSATRATLTFDWDTRQLQSKSNISVLVSSDGGAHFSILDTFIGGDSGDASYDLTPFISSNTVVRFQDQGADWVYGEYAYFDNIQISYSRPCPKCINYSSLENTFTPAVNANKLWNEPPYIQGQGVTVAVVDSGVADHMDFKDASGASRVLTHVSFATGSELPDDFYGHGTHIAGLIAGNGALSGNEYMGIAPQANLVDVKVLDDMGRGFTSQVVDGLEWIFENAAQYNIRVVNLSLNSAEAESYRTNALSAALELLWFKGITVVVAAGNNAGSQPGILYPPANDPYLITVGAADTHDTASLSDDILASFSSFGVTTEGYSRPDLVAPGTNMTSLLASDSNLVIEHPDKVVQDNQGNNFFQMSGTSVASPLVAGAAALLLQAEPELTPDQVKARLIDTARPFTAGNDAGYLDVYAAVHTQTPVPPDQAYIPNLLPAQMALIAYRASMSNAGDIDWNNLDWSAVNWDAVDWGSVNWGSVNWGSVNWGSVNWGSVNWGSVNWGSVNWGSVNWGSVNWGSVNWGSVNWGSNYWDD